MKSISIEQKKEIRNAFNYWLAGYCQEHDIPETHAYLHFAKNTKKRKQLTYFEIAAITDISVASVGHILAGRRNAGYSIAKRLSNLTSTDIELWVEGGADASEMRRTAMRDWAESGQQ